MQLLLILHTYQIHKSAERADRRSLLRKDLAFSKGTHIPCLKYESTIFMLHYLSNLREPPLFDTLLHRHFLGSGKSSSALPHSAMLVTSLQLPHSGLFCHY
jgi:hypothetical protein